MVCWLTLQILAASPVVNTVFMRTSTPCRLRPARTKEVRARPSDRAGGGPESVRESPATGSVGTSAASRRPAGRRRRGKRGRIVRTVNCRMRRKIGDGATTHAIITSVAGRSTRPDYRVGSARFTTRIPSSRPAAFPGLPHLASSARLGEPPRLPRVIARHPLPTRSLTHRLPSPPQITPVCHFPHGQMPSLAARPDALSSAASSIGQSPSRHPSTGSRVGVRGYPASRHGRAAHSRLIPDKTTALPGRPG